MPKMNFKQALSAIAEMGKFFEGFRTIESVIEGASGLEREIKDMVVSRDQVASEIKALSKRKGKQESILAELSDRIKTMKAEMVAEAKSANRSADEQKRALAGETADLDKARQAALKEHAEAMDNIKAETAEAKKVLSAVKRSMDRIKEKL